jgi:hypothetical protein
MVGGRGTVVVSSQHREKIAVRNRHVLTDDEVAVAERPLQDLEALGEHLRTLVTHPIGVAAARSDFAAVFRRK